MPDKKNILFITNGLGFGGAEKLLVEIVNRLDLNKFKMTIVSINSDMSLAQDIFPGCAELFVYPRRWRHDLSLASKIRELIVEKKIDVVVPFSMFAYFFARIATMRMKLLPRTYIYIHSTVPFSRKQYLLEWIYTRLLRGTEKFISVCNAQADFWAKTYDIPREKFITIYGGVDTEYFDYSFGEAMQRDIRGEYDIPSDALVVLQVAGLLDYKRQEDAIAAIKLLSNQSLRPVYLFLVGGGTDNRLAQLKNIAKCLGIFEKIIFCGNQNDVRPFINSADIFTLTSSRETFSIAALEAMAMGIPCVLTDIGGAREMIIEGENGLLVKPGNPTSIAAGWMKAIQQLDLLKKPHIRKMVMERFSIRKMIIDFEDILNQKG